MSRDVDGMDVLVTFPMFQSSLEVMSRWTFAVPQHDGNIFIVSLHAEIQ